MKLVFVLTFLSVIVAGVAVDNEKPDESLEHTNGLRSLGGKHCNDRGCGCDKPAPGPCGCTSDVDYGCGCGKPPPGKCGCDACECGYWDNHIWLYYDDKCITWGTDNWAVMAHCSKSDPYQEWYYKNGYIKSVKNSSKCLSYKEYGHSEKWLYVTKCDGGKNQKWDLEYHRISPAHNSHMCVDHCRSCGGDLHLRSCKSSWDHDQKFDVGDCFYDHY